MEGAAGPYNGPTVEVVFKDIKGCRAGMIKALTTDVEDFYQQCDPERDPLCLYGFPDETWKVNIPLQEVPSELPEPALGINLARDRMQKKDWVSLVADHSDALLLAVAVYYGARFGFEKNDRGRLFNMINELPTIFEVVTGTVKNHTKEKPVTNHNGNIWNRLRSMEGAAGPYKLHIVEEVFKDFRSRRAGMIKALTTDAEEFYQQCEPEKDTLCLYGFPNERWEVNLRIEGVPPKLPEPTRGINYARDGMQEKDWLNFIAVQSDAWLLAVAFYEGARFGFEKNDRGRLFNMINELPTIFEVVKVVTGEEDDTLCGACGEIYAGDEFWICCDMCEIWFHGKCVKITPARAGHMKQYKCPSCSRRH